MVRHLEDSTFFPDKNSQSSCFVLHPSSFHVFMFCTPLNEQISELHTRSHIWMFYLTKILKFFSENLGKPQLYYTRFNIQLFTLKSHRTYSAPWTSFIIAPSRSERISSFFIDPCVKRECLCQNHVFVKWSYEASHQRPERANQTNEAADSVQWKVHSIFTNAIHVVDTSESKWKLQVMMSKGSRFKIESSGLPLYLFKILDPQASHSSDISSFVSVEDILVSHLNL